MAIIMTKMSSRGQVAYAEAGNVVEQTVGAIRTVCLVLYKLYDGLSHHKEEKRKTIENVLTVFLEVF